MRTHVNGWGRAGNYYAPISSQIDKFVYNYPGFLPLFGAGNSGPAVSSLTSEANSKNALTIGSSQVPRPALTPDANFADQPASSSSLGPAGDGRIKPELMAPGSAVVSACSSLVESNYDANEMYALMGGSSMATAIAGGSIALLREYLEKDLQIEEPSAALVKASLVNGARLEDSLPSSSKGFGILDLAGTVLAMEEKSFILQDGISLKQGEAQNYSVVIKSSTQPFKATLAWTDPPAAAGSSSALVNNLDLIVEGPGGQIYYGNDFLSRGQADKINNIEQVYIPSPQPGTYTVKIRASNFGQGYGLQKYALVYGQALKQATISSMDEKQITLDDSRNIEWQEMQVKRFVLDGLKASAEHIKAGSQLYLSANGAAYIFSSSWVSSSGQMVSTSEGQLIMEANSQKREGGFYLDSRGAAESQILVNGETLHERDSFPTGAELKARVNPVYQTLWQLSAAYQEVSGYIANYDATAGKITLIHKTDTYILNNWATGSISNKLLNCSTQDVPYGYGARADLKNLLAGMKVTLMLSPGSNLVNYVKVERELVIGSAADIDTESETMRLNTGFVYNVFPGTVIKRDGENITLDGLEEGDHIVGLLLPGTNDLLQIEASSKVRYGKVIYCNNQEKSIYFMDSKNKVNQYRMTEETGIFHRGNPADRTSLTPGTWIRMVCCTENDLVQRIDIADVDKEIQTNFSAYYSSSSTLEMADGFQYYFTEATLLSKNGYCLMPEDILPGEKVKITILAAADSTRITPASVEVTQRNDASAPQLKINLRSLNGVLIVQGDSTADRIVLYREDGSRQTVDTDPEGHFSAVFKLLDQESKVQVMAINTKTGGIYGTEKDIQAYPVVSIINTFSDIELHPARSQIEGLASRGIVRGYQDGTYKPDLPITRVELVKLLADHEGWTPSGHGGVLFTDYQDVPWWALGAVNAAAEQGIIKGYTDGSLRPLDQVSWNEIALLMERVYSSDYDSKRIKTAISRGFQRGFISSAQAIRIDPSTPAVTRAQAALFIMWMENQI
ncbi:hypothetical protein ASZ90_019734 [hydrocarbon metagenome]|uniref:SLH domain-containing protein n=1 Tax=hydrocarbon metagenome TaxID=938273 RepID=A0A0W8E3B0_9ZZZZ